MTTRDYSTITPSARALLAMRAQSELPFARQAAELVLGSEALAAEHARLKAMPGSELRLRHFVERYEGIDKLLVELVPPTVVELGAGFSLRGLALTMQHHVTFVDTDLPELIETKRQLVADLSTGLQLDGDLQLRALDALDADAFRALVDELPPQPIAIVNEGLLMYLGDEEKRRLAANVRDGLAKRGGVWITADIYLRMPGGAPRIGQDDRLRDFLAAHNVEENKFESFAAAEQFFVGAGFAIEKRVPPALGPIRETWVLAPA